MKKYIFLFLLVIFANITFSQVSIPPSLNSFFIDYNDYLYSLTNDSLMESRILSGEGFFMDTENLTRWPEYFGNKHKLYKSKIDHFRYKQELDSLKNAYNSTHLYSGFSFGNFHLIGTKTKKLYTEYKLLVEDVYSFQNRKNIKVDKQIKRKNYYNIINYFDPNSEKYVEWRINDISDAVSFGKLHPYKITFSGTGFSPFLTEDESYNSSHGLNFGASFKSYWILGGIKDWKLFFATGIGYSANNTDLSTQKIEKKYENLIDIDQTPFNLIYNGTDIKQNFNFKSIDIPVYVSLDKFFESGKINVGIYGGLNFHNVFSEEFTQSSGKYEYKGEYIFDFYNDPVILSHLPRYGFDDFEYNQIIPEDNVKIKPFYLSAELGIESSYALSDKISLQYGIGYLKVLTPLYDIPNSKSYVDIIEGVEGNGFKPAANPLFAENDQVFLDKLMIKAGISYALFKPIIPHARKGWSNKQINKYVLDRSVIESSGVKLEEYILNCNVNLIANRASLFNQSVNFTFIGSAKSFKKGKIRSGRNRLEFKVPSSFNARLYLEEPYGYSLTFPEGLEVDTLGIYNDIKEIQATELWANNSKEASLDIELKKLDDIKINVYWYNSNLDYDLSARGKIQSRHKSDKDVICVLLDNSAPAVSTDNIDFLDDKLPLATSPFFNTFTFTNYKEENKISLRRNLIFTLIFPKSESRNIKGYINKLMNDYKLHPDYVEFRIEFYDLGISPLPPIYEEYKKDLAKMKNVRISEF